VSTYIATDGDPFEVVHSDRAFGGRRRCVLRVDGRSGDVVITGRVLLNGAVVPTPVAQNDRFTPESGQTAFLLTQTPAGEVEMFVNGARQRPDADFIVVADSAVWLNNGFELEPSDDVVFSYQK
jgi:hypothetical protein